MSKEIFSSFSREEYFPSHLQRTEQALRVLASSSQKDSLLPQLNDFAQNTISPVFYEIKDYPNFLILRNRYQQTLFNALKENPQYSPWQKSTFPEKIMEYAENAFLDNVLYPKINFNNQEPPQETVNTNKFAQNLKNFPLVVNNFCKSGPGGIDDENKKRTYDYMDNIAKDFLGTLKNVNSSSDLRKKVNKLNSDLNKNTLFFKKNNKDELADSKDYKKALRKWNSYLNNNINKYYFTSLFAKAYPDNSR